MLRNMKVAVAAAALLISFTAQSQQIDAAVGASVLKAPPASSAIGNYSPQSLRGGLYPTVARLKAARYGLRDGPHPGVCGQVVEQHRLAVGAGQRDPPVGILLEIGSGG